MHLHHNILSLLLNNIKQSIFQWFVYIVYFSRFDFQHGVLNWFYLMPYCVPHSGNLILKIPIYFHRVRIRVWWCLFHYILCCLPFPLIKFTRKLRYARRSIVEDKYRLHFETAAVTFTIQRKFCPLNRALFSFIEFELSNNGLVDTSRQYHPITLFLFICIATGTSVSDNFLPLHHLFGLSNVTRNLK